MKQVFAVLLLAGLCAASQHQNYDRSNNDSPQAAKPFRAGYEYHYKYNGQIASGLEVSNAPLAADEPEQKATTRIQAKAKIVFESAEQATLQLENIRLAQLNSLIESPQQVQPMAKFEQKQLEQDKQQKLELPLKFEYNNGVVGRIQFHADDSSWSANIKRGVLNMIQLNLKQQQGSSQQQQQQWAMDSAEQQGDDQSPFQTFTLPEITIEGDCQTTYTISKNKRQQQRQSSDEQSDEQDSQDWQQDNSQSFNVTKAINFKKCSKIADVALGYQTQQQQPQCAKCKLPQQQQRQAFGPQQMCSEECDPKEIKEQKLERTTVLRFVLNGKNPQQPYGIKKTELVSQYVYKNLKADNNAHASTMQTVVAAELVYESSQPQQQQSQRSFRSSSSDQHSSLLFDNEWIVKEKLFYMVGDEDFSQENSPFAKVSNKVDKAKMYLRKLTEALSNKPAGIEAHDALQLQRMVEVLRMCTMEELKTVYEQASQGTNSQRSGAEQQKAEQILSDALAIAGTRNTIQLLANKIRNQQMNTQQAIQALKQLSGLPAPSDKQAEIILSLCQNERVQSSKALKQTCWLTFGSMVGELCQQKTQKSEMSMDVFGTQTGFTSMQQCSSAKKQDYKKALMEEYDQAQTTYEKVLALKALGNAAIDTAVTSLEKVINDRRESPIVRVQAIDALRRVRQQMPRKIQRVLLPILQNTRENAGVRMACFALIISTNPEQPILDQVIYTLSKERDPNVQAYVYSSLKALANSQVPCHQQMAKHLKSTLKLANVDEQQLKISSQKFQVPIFSGDQQEGVYLMLASAFINGNNNIVPNYLSATLNTMLNEEFEMNTVEAALMQQGTEQWYEGLIQAVLSPKASSKTRGQRSSANPRNQEQLQKIFSGLKIMKRQGTFQDDFEQQSQQGRQQQGRQQQQKQPFAMFTMRVGDVDTAIVPIDEQSLPSCLKALVYGQRPSISECFDTFQKPQHVRLYSAMNLNEKQAKIPTSMGITLRVMQASPVLASIEGQFKANADQTDGLGVNAQVSLHSSACVAYVQKMETYIPIISTGVECSIAAELNIPVQATVQITGQGTVKTTLKTPEELTRLLGLHTLPLTFTRDTHAYQMREPKVKSIHVPRLEQLQREVDFSVGQQTTGMPVRVQGHVHRPADITDYKQLAQLALCSENHLHFDYQPQGDSPKEIFLRAEPTAFNKLSRRSPALDNFYSKNSAFDNLDNEHEFDELESHDQRRAKLNTFLNQFQSPMYKHQIKLTAETKGGRKQVKAQAMCSASCDAKFNYCQMEMDADRSAMFRNEKSDWTLRSKLQVLTPEAVSNVQQIQGQDDKNRKLVVQGEAEWGTDHKQTINFRVQGQKAHTKHWRQQIDQQFKGPQQKFQQKQAAFINRFDVVADYKLKPQTQSAFERAFEMIKQRAGFWNTDVQDTDNNSHQSGQIRGSVIIDPITQEHVNISANSPSQSVRIQTMELPFKIRPFPLVRRSDKSSHNFKQLFHRSIHAQGRAECSVDGRRIETFDNVEYKAPIGKCYSVLAKDCSSADQPEFVVLMKAMNNGQEKKIKVVTPEQTIECQPARSSSARQGRRLQCTVNGQTINAQDQQQQQQENGNSYYGSHGQVVEYNNDEQTDVTIDVEGVQVRFGCWGSQNCKSQKAWIKLSSQYKEAQCGLCGHYDDQTDDEWRMADNEVTEDLTQFHRSYSLRNGDDEECSMQEQDNFYGKRNSHKFGRIDDYSQQQENDGDYNQQEDQDDEDQEWQAGAYHTDGSSSEEDQWGRSQAGQQWKMKNARKGLEHKKMKNKRQQQGSSDDDAPMTATKVLEYNHKVCFSVQPVKQCGRGTYPDNDDQQATTKKTQFACLSRADPKARQMQRQARRGVIADTSDMQPSFVENVREPSRCVAY